MRGLLYPLVLLVVACQLGACERTPPPPGAQFEHQRHTWTTGEIDREGMLAGISPFSTDQPTDGTIERVLLYKQIETDRDVHGAAFSWNVRPAADTPVIAEIAVAPAPDGPWSPFMRIASWPSIDTEDMRTNTSDLARLSVDELICTDRVRVVRIVVGVPGGHLGRPIPAVERVDLTLTLARPHGLLDDPAGEPVTVVTPFRSNDIDNDELRTRLCSPIALAMLMEQRGVSVPLDDIADTAYDPEHRIYGNWVRAIQTGYTFGVPGYLTRFGSWAEVREHLATVGPIAISITAEDGEVRGSHYDLTGGHLVVLYGLDENGDALVLDPAFDDEAEARRTYHRDDLTNVWLNRKKGTAYVLLDPADG